MTDPSSSDARQTIKSHVSPLVDELLAVADAQAAAETMPWTALVVDVEPDARECVDLISLPVLAVDAADFLSAIAEHRCVLLVTPRAQAVAGDLERLGVECYGKSLPPGHRFLASLLEERAKAADYFIARDELVEVFAAFARNATRLADVPPTGHAELRPRPKRQTRLRTLEDIVSMPPVPWLVRCLLPAPSVAFLVGPPNVGKSTVALDLGLRVYHGAEFHGRAVTGGSVLYIAGEGVAGIGARVAAWRQQHNAGEPAGRYFAIATGLPPLSSDVGRAELRATIDDLVRAHGHAPAMVIIDTLAAHWAESEDKSEHVGPCMAFLARLAEQHGATVLLLHHERKPGTEKPAGGGWAAVRGSGAWVGAADAVLQLVDRGDAIELATVKQRDAERAAPIRLRLLSVNIGTDAEGKPRSGAIMVPAGEALPNAGGDDGSADLERDVGRVVAALRSLGSAPSKAAIYGEARMKAKRGVQCIDVASARKLIVDVGTARKPDYRLAGVCVQHPIPQGNVGNAFPGFPDGNGNAGEWELGRPRKVAR